MSITLGSNIASLQAQRQLFKTGGSLSSVFERLSSGQRINRASDDAAGLAISESLRTDRRVYNQAIRNLNDGLSVLNIADSTVAELSSVVIRIQELAEQAANGSLSNTQRASLDAEAQALSDEFFRVSRSADFNNLKLFDGSLADGVRLQGGYGTDGSIFSSLGGEMGNGTFQSAVSYGVGSGPRSGTLGDFNGDGTLDMVSGNSVGDSYSIRLGNGDGTFQAGFSYGVGDTITAVATSDLNGDGVLDLALGSASPGEVLIVLGNGDGTFQSAQTYSVGSGIQQIEIADINGDGVFDLATANYNVNTISLLYGNGDGSFQSEVTFASPFGAYGLSLGDIDGDGRIDLAVSGLFVGEAVTYLQNSDGTFQASQTFSFGGAAVLSTYLEDINGDGQKDLITPVAGTGVIEVAIGNGDGTFQSGVSFAAYGSPRRLDFGDVNGDGNLDIVSADQSNRLSVFLNDGEGSFNETNTYNAVNGVADIKLGDLDEDGVLDIVTFNETSSTASVLLGNTREGIAPILDFSLETQADALQALAPLDRKLQSLSEQRGVIGAFQSRIQSAINTLGATSENYASAESRIRDADIAFETSQLTRLNILQQAASSVLGQANQQPALALRLLS